MDLIDILFGIAIMIVILLILFLYTREKNKQWRLADESIARKYELVFNFFMKQEGANLIDLTQNEMEIRIKTSDHIWEDISIIQDNHNLKIDWILVAHGSSTKRHFAYENIVSQEAIIEKTSLEINQCKGR